VDSTFQIALAVGFLIFVGTLLLLYGVFKKRINLNQRLNREAAASSEESALDAVAKRFEQVLIPMGEMLPRSPAEMSKQERRLAQAGIRRKEAVLLFLGSHIMTAIVLLVIFSITGHLYRQPLLFFFIAILGGAAIPDIWLKRKIENRKQNIQYALPDAMDLAVISVEAGLGLDQALMRVGEEIRTAHPDLADELRLRNLEVNMGRSRADAFRNLADRTGVDD
jgi:tight adherence protein C